MLHQICPGGAAMLSVESYRFCASGKRNAGILRLDLAAV